MKMRSNLDKREDIIPVFACKSSSGFHFWFLTGFVAAIIVVLVFILQTMPAFATEIVYCSIASWILPLSSGLMIENSSIVTIPQSASTKAPASRTYSFPSLKQLTVSPAEVVPIPVVETDLFES